MRPHAEPRTSARLSAPPATCLGKVDGDGVASENRVVEVAPHEDGLIEARKVQADRALA